MAAKDPGSQSLYELFAGCPTEAAPVGETAITRQKETLDNDVEEFDSGLVEGSTYDLLASFAPSSAVRGETKITKTVETMDEEQSELNGVL